MKNNRLLIALCSFSAGALVFGLGTRGMTRLQDAPPGSPDESEVIGKTGERKATVQRDSPGKATARISGADEVKERLLKVVSSGTCPKRGQPGWDQFIDDFIRYSMTDPIAAQKILDQAVIGQPREDVVALHMFYAQGLAQADPLQAVKWATEIQDSKISTSSLDGIFSVWLQNPSLDPMQALEQLSNFKGDGWAGIHISKAIDRLAAADIGEAEHWVAENLSKNPQLYYAAVTTLFREAGSQNPQMLADMIDSYDLGTRRMEFVAGAISSLSSKDLDAALEFARLSKGKDYENAVLDALASRSLASSPDEVTRLVNEAAPDRAAQIMSRGISQWLRDDIDLAEGWLGEQSLEFRTDLATHGIPSVMATRDPEAAIKFVDDLQLGASDKEAHYQGIVGIWSADDPDASLKWIARLDEGLQASILVRYVEGVARENVNLVQPFLQSVKLSESGRRAAENRLAELAK